MEFPYKFRKGQERIVRDIMDVVESGNHIVLEAPTGSGKTIAALYPAVKFAVEHGKKVIYLVHTNSQGQQVIKEAQKLGVFAVALQGRRNLCPLVREREDMRGGNAEELSILCGRLKREVSDGNLDACPYFHGFLEKGDILENYIREVHTAEEVFFHGLALGICPYEAIKDTMKDADVIVLPYIYFFSPIRRVMMDKIGVPLQDIVLIVDEAHNIPDFARELNSLELSTTSLDRMQKEAVEYGNPRIMGQNLADLGEFLKEAIYSMEKFLQEEEGFVPQYALEEEIARLTGIGINDVDSLAKDLIHFGEMIREDKAKRRKLPRSYIYHAGVFLQFWKQSYSHEYIRMIRWGSNPTLEIYCLDPSIVTDVLKGVHSSIHMSGTLAVKDYRDLVGLPQTTVVKRYESPFPKDRLKVLYVEDVTTKYEEVDRHIGRIAEYIQEIMSIGRSTAIFFPSYTLLERVQERIGRDALSEEKGMKQADVFNLIEKFRSEGGGMLSVLGGRIFEGLNFPGEELEIVVIVGIPYPKPTPKVKALERYYDAKFGNGWEYAFRMPAMIKMRQAIGRLIRGEEDRGVAVILDRRAPSFSDEIEMKRAENLREEIEEFFKKFGE